jgi:putative ABC transport system permease protein
MFNKDRWNEILKVLTTNWFRTVLTSFGVFWGIFILIILLAARKGLENGIRADFGGIATNTMFMWTQSVTKDYKGLPKDRSFNFKTEDVNALWQNIPGLRFVSPRNQSGGLGEVSNAVRGLKTGNFKIYGDFPEIIQQQPMDITSGRFINYSDIKEKRKVLVIGADVKKSLYEIDEEVIGSYIKINDVNFMVIGTYKKKRITEARPKKKFILRLQLFHKYSIVQIT